MCRSLLLSTFLTQTCFSLLIVASGNSTCLEKYSGIYLTQNKNLVAQLTLYSSDGTLLSIDSNQKTGSPTIEGRNDKAGQWKCRDSNKPDILTQSIQVEESTRAADQLVARLHETETTCSSNKRTNCSDIIQYRELNITISIEPPRQVYTLASNFYSSEARTLFLNYDGYANQQQRDLKCLKEKSGLYVIEYEKKSSDDGVKKTYGLFLLKNDGFFFLINSNERENGTHKFGTMLGRWKCTGNRIFATGNYFIYYPQRKLGEVIFSIDPCSSPITHACTGNVKSRHYPLQFHQRPFEKSRPKTRQNIIMSKYLSAAQTNNKRCYKNFAGTYFVGLGSANDSTDGGFFDGVYRTIGLFRDGRVYGNSVAEILPKGSAGNLIGFWTCNETNSSSTHIHASRVQFSYDTNGGSNLETVATDFTCDNKVKNCRGQTIYRVYNPQLPDKGQFHDAVTTYIIQPVVSFYAYLPPY